VRVKNITYLVDKRGDGRLLLRPITAVAYGLSSFESLPVYEFEFDRAPLKYSFGIPVFTGEAHIACVSCNRFDSGREGWDVVTQRISDNTPPIYLFLPERWDVNFFRDPGDGGVLVDAYEVDANNERTNRASFTVIRHNKEEVGTLKDFVDNNIKPFAMGFAKGLLFFDGPSLFDPDAYDIVYPNESFIWSHVVEGQDGYYELVFRNSFTYFGRYADVFDLLLKSFKVIEVPPIEEVVE